MLICVSLRVINKKRMWFEDLKDIHDGIMINSEKLGEFGFDGSGDDVFQFQNVSIKHYIHHDMSRASC